MTRTPRTESQFATPAIEQLARQLGQRVRQARVSRQWTQIELAERSRISAPTMQRIEAGSVAVSIGAWLGVLERLGLLAQLQNVEDRAATALLRDAAPKRVRKRKPSPDTLDF